MFRCQRSKRFLLITLSCGILYSPVAGAYGDTKTESTLLKTQDIALAADGLLTGYVLDNQGRPAANAPVIVLFRKKPIAKTHTNARGVFQIRGLRAGFHSIQSSDAMTHCRLWTKQAAPPSARKGALVVNNGEIVRGQWGMLCCVDPIQVALGAGALAALIVAIDAHEDNEDLKNRLDNLERRLPVSP